MKNLIGFILIWASGVLIGRQWTITVLSSKSDMKEYQVELDMDTVRVYQYGRYVDCYIIEDGKLNQFDEICAMDNR